MSHFPYDRQNYIYLFIDWCLTSTLAVFQLYRGVNKLYILDTYTTLRNK